MTLELPEADAPRAGAPRTTLAALPVLVVDDDAASNELVREALGAHGCVVEVVPNAERALVAVRAFRPRVVVMDLVQPLMSGLLLAQRLQQAHHTPELVLVALAGFGGRDTERVAREAGFATCAPKPIDPDAFARALAAAVGAAR